MQHKFFQNQSQDVVLVSSSPLQECFSVYECVRTQFICSERLISDTLCNELPSMCDALIRHMKKVDPAMLRPHRIHKLIGPVEPKQIRLGSAPRRGKRQSYIRGKTWERTVTADMPSITLVGCSFQLILYFLLNKIFKHFNCYSLKRLC